MISVLVADDQDLVRAGLRMILDAQPGIEVVGEAADGREAVTLARRLRPDVCLFDIRMPELDGIEATRLLAGPDVDDPLVVVVITTFDLDEYVHGALKAGAPGIPPEGCRRRPPRPGRARRGQRRCPHCSERDGPPVGIVLRGANECSPSPTGRAAHREGGRGPVDRGERPNECRDRERTPHWPEHRQDTRCQPHDQARRAESGRGCDVGLRDGSPQPVAPTRATGRVTPRARASVAGVVPPPVAARTPDAQRQLTGRPPGPAGGSRLRSAR